MEVFIMKYEVPASELVKFDDADIIATSRVEIEGDGQTPGMDVVG